MAGIHRTAFKYSLWKLGETVDPGHSGNYVQIEIDVGRAKERVDVDMAGPRVIMTDGTFRHLVDWDKMTSTEKQAILLMTAKKNRARRQLLEAKGGAGFAGDSAEAAKAAEERQARLKEAREEEARRGRDEVAQRLARQLQAVEEEAVREAVRTKARTSMIRAAADQKRMEDLKAKVRNERDASTMFDWDDIPDDLGLPNKVTVDILDAAGREPAEPRVEYRVLRGELFKKAHVADTRFFRVPAAVGSIVGTTGQVSVSPSGRYYVKLAPVAGEARGWALVEDGFSVFLKRVAGDGDTGSTSAVATPAAKVPQPTTWRPSHPQRRMPRVLCLHGTSCGNDIFKMQLNRLVPAAKDTVELVFLEGPLEINSGPAFETMQKFFPGKPNRQYDEVLVDNRGWRRYKDTRKTLQWLQTQLRSHAPIDGVLGFSQGANFAIMLAAQAACGVGAPVAFVVALGPNPPGYLEDLEDLFQEPIPVPALVVRGLQEGYGAGMEAMYDALREVGAFDLDTKGEDVPAAHAMRLFTSCEELVHPEGHRPLPGNKTRADEIAKRIASFALEASAGEHIGDLD